MKVWITKKYYDIENNFEGIDDTHIKIYDSKPKALAAFLIEANSINNYFLRHEDSLDNCEIEQEENLYHVNNGRDYITLKLEEMEIL